MLNDKEVGDQGPAEPGEKRLVSEVGEPERPPEFRFWDK